MVGLEQAVAAPFATRQLADLGARVVKVERPPHGDFARGYDETVHGLSSYFVWLNRGKQSIGLDLRDAHGRSVFAALLARADVLVHNLAPGAVDRLGFGEDVLAARFPRLVSCAISGFGAGGPYEHKKAYDLLIQCEAGLPSVTGTPESQVKAGISVADIAAGMYAYTGVLAALLHRERTGAGSRLRVSMLEALAEWLTQPYLYSAFGRVDLPRTGLRHASVAPYGPYPVAGGERVFLGVQNDREWERLCQGLLGDVGLASDPRFARNSARVRNSAELDRLLEAALARFSAAQAEALLDELGIANARLRGVRDLGQHPQLAARERWTPTRTPSGVVPTLLPPVEVVGAAPVLGAVPAYDEHRAAILAELAG